MPLKYKWECLTEACPEQYDVFDEQGRQVAYVRARWGRVTASCPDFGGYMVFDDDFADDGMSGCFKDTDQRNQYQRLIEDAIDGYYVSLNK